MGGRSSSEKVIATRAAIRERQGPGEWFCVDGQRKKTNREKKGDGGSRQKGKKDRYRKPKTVASIRKWDDGE